MQARLWGTGFYYTTVGPTSVKSYNLFKTYPQYQHDETWTEWSASYLSYYYFGKPSDWNFDFAPISPVNSPRPQVGPGRELPYGWMYGTLPQGLITLPPN